MWHSRPRLCLRCLSLGGESAAVNETEAQRKWAVSTSTEAIPSLLQTNTAATVTTILRLPLA
jgi:hypothetical protein